MGESSFSHKDAVFYIEAEVSWNFIEFELI